MPTESPPLPGLSFRDKTTEAVKTKGLKYSMVSVFNVLFGFALIFVVQAILPDHDKPKANALAVLTSAVPAYYLSRTWVWGKRGKSELRREVLPFWIFVALGLVISTVGVAAVQYLWRNLYRAEMPGVLTYVINLGAFGVLWVLRFLWMDRVFHLDHHHAHGPLDVLLDEDEPLD